MKKRWVGGICALLAAGLLVAWLRWPRAAATAPGVPTTTPTSTAATDALSDPATRARLLPDASTPPPEEPLPWLTGEVVDEIGGVAQADVAVTLRAKEHAPDCAADGRTRSVAGGGFVVGPLCPGQYDVKASRGPVTATAVARLTRGLARARVVLRLRAGTRLEVRVRDEKRAPVAGAEVEVQENGSGYSAEGLTDARGAVVIDGLAPRVVSVFARKAGYLPASLASRSLAVGDERVDLVLADAARVEGRVVGPDGEPLADADLRVGTRSRQLNGGFDTRVYGDTGDGGYFSLGPVRPGPYTLVVKHPGYRRAEKEVRAPGPKVTVMLTRGTTLDGVFLDADGQPVFSADITGRTNDESDKIDPDYTDGGFHAEGLSNGDWTVVGFAKGADGGALGIAVSKFRVKDQQAVAVTLELERGEAISGRCVEQPGGAPAETDVIAVEDTVFKKLMLGGFAMAAAKPGTLSLANCKGTFRIEGLKPGKYRLVACGNHEDPPAFPTGAADAVITCAATGKLTYRVVDAQRRPVTQYSSFGPPEDHPDGRTERELRGDLDEVLVVRAPGYATLQRQVNAPASARVDLGDLVLTKARTLKGVVLDGKRQPVAGAELRYAVDSTEALATARTPATGTFELADVPAEDSALFVAHPDFKPARKDVRAGDAVVEVVLEPARRIGGAVVTRDGRTLPGVVVVALSADPAWTPPKSDDVADGRYELGALPADGTLTLRLEASEGAAARLSGFGPVKVTDAPVVDLVERLGGSTFALAPVDDEGQPIEATVWLVPGTPAFAAEPAAKRGCGLEGIEGDAEQDTHVFTAVPAGRWTAVVFVSRLKAKFWTTPVEVNPGMAGVLRLVMPRGLY